MNRFQVSFKGKNYKIRFRFFIHSFHSIISKSQRRMEIKIVSIMLSLFIFGITTHGWADSVKSMNNASNQIKTIKLDENNVNGQKKNGSVKEPFKTTKKREAGFHSAVPYS